jgi:PPOX class probable FMN-dependent enzyme
MDDRASAQSGNRWQSLVTAALAAADEDPTVRFVQLATVDPEGIPFNRTVVVRAFRPETGELEVVTDARSQKVAHLHVNPRVALCWYLTSTREQFRFRGMAALVGAAAQGDAQARRQSAWASLSARTRRQFVWPAPGTPKTGDPFDPPPLPDDRPPETFVLLRIHPDFVDHLVLTSTPHRRTLYRLDTAGHWLRQCVNP